MNAARFLALCLALIPFLPARTIELTNVSYDPTRQLYLEINAAFSAQWRAKTGDTVKVRQSHGSMGWRPTW